MSDSKSKERCGREDIHRLLARYELGGLDDDERRIFEKHVLECDICFEKLERGAACAALLRGHAGAYARMLRGRPTAPERPSRAVWSAALEWLFRPRVAVPAALVILAVGVLTLRTALSPDPSSLATFPREELATHTLRAPGVQDAIRELLEAGAGYFVLERYEEAERHFRAAFGRDSTLAEAVYLAGLSRALAGDAGGAIPDLETAVRLAGDGLRAKSSWTLANAYLGAGRTDDAARTLRSLASEQGEYARRARQLLERLGR
ncbi:MAG: tetratricopeptide repeat protein [Candidatus Krumholzibacteriia bacterium]